MAVDGMDLYAEQLSPLILTEPESFALKEDLDMHRPAVSGAKDYVAFSWREFLAHCASALFKLLLIVSCLHRFSSVCFFAVYQS
jgi:hypothetical protein